MELALLRHNAIVTPDDVHFLASPAGRALLAEARDSRNEPIHRRHRAFSKTLPTEQVRLVLEQDDLRARAVSKVPFAQRLLFERVALEQATAWSVAEDRATRWPNPSTAPLADLGAGLGFDALAAARTRRPVLAIERDAGRVALLRHNAQALGCEAHLQIVCGDIETTGFELPLAFLDPDQRIGKRRTRAPEDFSPPADRWLPVLAPFQSSMIKVPPNTTADDVGDLPFEVVSLDGRARERRLFVGAWDALPMRRALSLPTAKEIAGAGIQGPMARTPREGDALLDADAAVWHADLIGDLAARDNLAPLNRARAYLVADEPVGTSPGTWLRIDAVLPFTPKAMNAWLRAHHIGSLTIRKRGIDAKAAAWRPKLKPKGPNAGTLILTCDPNERWIALGAFDITP